MATVCAEDTNAPAAASQTPAPVAQPVFASPPDSSTNSASPNGAPAVQNLVVTAPAAERFDGAMASYSSGQFADAITAFSDFISIFPQDRRREEALYRLAESYRRLGRKDDALDAYAFQVKSYPEGQLRVNADLQRAAILFDQGKFPEAIPPLTFVAKNGDEDLQQAANYLLGRSLLATHNEAEARPILQSLADANPPGKFTGGAAQILAELDDSQNHPAEAVPLWQRAFDLATDPTAKTTAAARGGWSALDAKEVAQAETLFEAVLKFDAQGEARKVANTGLLRIYFQEKDYGKWTALYASEKTMLLDSARAEILYDLGHAEFSLKHWSAAVVGFDQYLAAFPTQDAAVTADYERFLALAQMDRGKTVAEAKAYLQTWPKSPYTARVHLLQAQELSREGNYGAALPIWQNLATEVDPALPHQDILLEVARAEDELNDFPQAAAGYQAYLDAANAHPASAQHTSSILRAEARLAVCLQRSDQLLAATDAWKTVQSVAPHGSPEQQAALEALGLIYARGGPAQENDMVSVFRDLLATFPESPLRALAAFSVGDSLFKGRNYLEAEPLLLDARNWDAATWMQPATQRLVLAAYGLKDEAQCAAYLKQYETLPIPADPQARIAARLPAALFYWLGEQATQTGRLPEAESYYARVTQHPESGELLPGAWWQLGEIQTRRREWPAAVISYEKYRELKPGAKDATVVLLALGRAELGAKNFDAARTLGNQALLGEPEGPHSAAARMLLGETSYATQNYAEAARMFATLAVLFDDPKITPQAMIRAADSFSHAGDAKAANDWLGKLQARYPAYQDVPYL